MSRILKTLANFFKFVIRNSSQSFSVVAVLVYFQCYILILWLLYLGKLFLRGFLLNKKELENSLKYGDNAPLSFHPFTSGSILNGQHAIGSKRVRYTNSYGLNLLAIVPVDMNKPCCLTKDEFLHERSTL